MTRSKALLIYHICVVLWGFTSILGKLISFEAMSLVWWRLAIVSGSLSVFYAFFGRKSLKTNRKHLAAFFGIGLIIAIHWVALYGAIKVSNIAITMVSFSSISFFSALIEPVVFKRRIRVSELTIGALVMVGIWFIAQSTEGSLLGYLLGIIAAFTASLFSVINGKMIEKASSKTITYYELLGALIWMSLYMPFSGITADYVFSPSGMDLFWLAILSILCTAVPFLLSIQTIRVLGPFTINLIINLEVIYAIVIGFLIFGESEQMSTSFYIGAFLIILLIIFNGYLKRRTF
ncbi:MAG: DMT family transporter [Flavobacteriales bacterium]|nr:DMT family transporter [Flavobacteriales bacterium]